jgi:phytoene synthase
MPGSAVIYAPPLPEVAFLVDAAGTTTETRGRSDALIEVLATLEAHRRRRDGLIGGATRLS